MDAAELFSVTNGKLVLNELNHSALLMRISSTDRQEKTVADSEDAELKSLATRVFKQLAEENEE